MADQHKSPHFDRLDYCVCECPSCTDLTAQRRCICPDCQCQAQAAAEALTDRLLAPAYGVLDPTATAALVAGIEQLAAAT